MTGFRGLLRVRLKYGLRLKGCKSFEAPDLLERRAVNRLSRDSIDFNHPAPH